MRERAELAEKMRRVAALAVDVEGSLTDGRIGLADDRDGGTLRDHDRVGLQLAVAAGWPVILLSAGEPAGLAGLGSAVGAAHVATGVGDKLAALTAAATTLKLDLATVAYLGDDLLDLPAMERCGLAAAPRNAVVLVREKADLVLELPAGHGALRELVDRVLEVQEATCRAIAGYLKACGDVAPGEALASPDEQTLRPKIGFRA